MKRSILYLSLLFCFLLSAQEQIKPTLITENIVINEYHGVKIEDPYQYLENLENPMVVNWMKDNANYARNVLDEIPGRKDFLEKMYEFDSRVADRIFSVNVTSQGQYFYLKARPEDENGKLYMRKNYSSEEKLLFDPDKYRTEEAVNYTISSFSPNYKGDKIALFLSANGSENSDLIIIDNNGKTFPEMIDRCTSWNNTWLADDESILYSRFNSSDIKDQNRQMNMKSYLHKTNTNGKDDMEFFSNTTNPELQILSEEIPIPFYNRPSNKFFGGVFTVDKRIKLYMAEDSNFSPPLKWKQITSQADNVVNFELDKNSLYYLSFDNAPNYKILKATIANPSAQEAKIIVPEFKDEIITNMATTKDGLYFTTMKNGVEAKVYFLGHNSNTPKVLKTPLSAGDISLSKIDEEHSEIWMNMSGWTSPNKRYAYDLKNDKFIKQPLSTEVEYPELKGIVVKEVMIPSHDGVNVPVSIICKNDTKLNGKNPTLIYGYGSYGNSISPFFSPLVLNYVNRGGIWVIPHVRGGGELGDAWHKAGQKLNKPNTWKDAIATAEYLIKEKYTSANHLAIWGGSAGGIFVGRSITERPDLFAAAIPEVGAMNTVRMEESPNGPINAPEFGTVKDPLEFKGLLEMDSYLHVKKGVEYPALLITAGMNDPRVIAWEPGKFAARMQASSISNKPVLFLTDFESGHGIGDSKSKRFESFADTFSFALWQTGHSDFQPNEKIQK
ncbi:prolyl oligopeptidase family serine peptidase [Namhaeicola litoreus]|uniref:prolyl oligopeptidase n=1 Tax=Namhaeicola litoreus TaxID=1052145 RepID=A0ABW3XY51_9FLAO